MGGGKLLLQGSDWNHGVEKGRFFRLTVLIRRKWGSMAVRGVPKPVFLMEMRAWLKRHALKGVG